MRQPSKYQARLPDTAGLISYAPAEHSVWRDLFTSQGPLLNGRACEEYLLGLERLELPEHRIPQCAEISERLGSASSWRVQPVAALIEAEEFFDLLSHRTFPAASFIRTREEFEYLREPDIFHEIFGHTPLLTHSLFADFSQHIGETGRAASPEYHEWLARLYWMTIEFGLVESPEGLRAYGAGIISSRTELAYSLESCIPERRRFNALDALRTPYRIDRLQPVYYVLQSFRELANLCEKNLLSLIDNARELGMFASPPEMNYGA